MADPQSPVTEWDAQGKPILAANNATEWDANGKPITATSPTAPQGSWWDRATAPYTEIQPHQPVHSISDLGREVVRGVGNIGGGALGVALHPLDTAKGLFQQFSDVLPSYQMTPLGPVPVPNRAGIEHAREQAQQVINQPLGTAEQAIGQAGALEGAGELAGGMKRIVPKIARGGMDIVAGTTPKVAADLGETTAAENAAAQAAADKANAKLQADRSVDLQKHFERTQAVRAQNESAQGSQSRKVALNRGVEQLDPKFKEDLFILRDNVQSKANQMFGDLNSKLDPIEADSSFLPNALEAAAEKIKGSNTEPTILRDMEKRLSAISEPLTYRDLQGYYSELGRELSKGTLPGDVYHAYDTLQEAISDQMQQIAGANDLGDALTSARQYYRQMKQTFFDPKSPVMKALNSTEAGQSIKQLQGKDQSGIGAIAQYDPELAKRANTIRGYQAEAKSIPARTVTPKPEPPLPPPEPHVLADVKKIGLGDIQQAKAASMADRANAATTGAAAKMTSGAMSGIAAFDFMRNILHGNLGAAGVDIAARGGLSTLQYAYGKMLSNPAVIRLMTAPTAADIATIPPDLRAEMPQIVQAAQARGIKVHPALLTLGAARTQPVQ